MEKSILYICDTWNAIYGITARGTIYRERLIEAGWKVRYITKKPYLESLQHLDSGNVEVFVSDEEIVKEAQAYRIVYFIKSVDSELVWKIKTQTKCIIVYDVYDRIWAQYSNIGNMLFENVDVFISEGRYLCNYMVKYHKPLFNLYSVCIYDEMLEKEVKTKSSKIVVGWLGSSSTVSAVYSVINPLQRLAERYSELELRILGADILDIRFPQNQISCVKRYDYDIMLRELSNFDIGIFPPPGDKFDYEIRGPHKGVRYMGAKKPAIFYRAGDCMDFVEDGKNAMLYENEEEFEKKLDSLIKDRELRRQMGLKGYMAVKDRYSMDVSFSMLNNILNAILQMKFLRFSI